MSTNFGKHFASWRSQLCSSVVIAGLAIPSGMAGGRLKILEETYSKTQHPACYPTIVSMHIPHMFCSACVFCQMVGPVGGLTYVYPWSSNGSPTIGYIHQKPPTSVILPGLRSIGLRVTSSPQVDKHLASRKLATSSHGWLGPPREAETQDARIDRTQETG